MSAHAAPAASAASAAAAKKPKSSAAAAGTGTGAVAGAGAPESEDVKYKQKCKDLKRRIQEIEDHNDVVTIKIARAKRAVQRLRLERAFLLEKLEERTFMGVGEEHGKAQSTSNAHHSIARATQPASRSPSLDGALMYASNTSMTNPQSVHTNDTR